LWAIVRLWPTALITNTFEEHPIRVTCRPSQDSFFRGGRGVHCLSGQMRTSGVAGVTEGQAVRAGAAGTKALDGMDF